MADDEEFNEEAMIFSDSQSNEKSEKSEDQNAESQENSTENDDDEVGNVDDYIDKYKQKAPKPQQNKGISFNRNHVFILLLAIVCASGIFFSFKHSFFRKKDEKVELSKAGKVSVPVLYYENDTEIAKNEFNYGLPENLQQNDEDVKVRSIDEVLNDGKQPAEPQPQIVQSGASSAGGAKVDTRGNAMQKSVRRMVWNDSPQQEPIQVGQNGGMLNAITGQYMPYSMTQEGQASKNAMLANALSGANLGGGNSAYSMQNDQAGKQAFLNANAGKSGMTQHNLATLYTGTIVPLVLETGINTDLPGVVIARATKNIYSSFDGRYLIIPEGTRFFATYNSSISYHQNRVQVVWNTMIRPDGLEVNLGNMNGVDTTGMSGYKGFVNEHPFEYAKAIGLIAGFSILTTGFTVINSNLANNLYAQNAVAATGQQLSNIADDLINRALNIQPTITVKNGVEVDLITNVPLNLPPLEIPAVNEKYVRY